MSKEGDVLVLSRAATVLVLVIEAILDTAAGLSLPRRGVDLDSQADGCAVIRLRFPVSLSTAALRLSCRSMEELTGTIPIACEYSLSVRWYKQAEGVFADDGKLQLWNP